MGRVVPSEIVRIIDRTFPFAARDEKPEKGHAMLGVKHVGRVSAVLALIDQLPDELLPLTPADYADFIAVAAQLRSNVSATIAVGREYTFYGETLWRLRHILFRCSDWSSAAAVHELKFIRPKLLREDLRADLAEANAALNHGRWKAATILAGSLIEALLVWRLSKLGAVERQAAVGAVNWPDPRDRPQGPPMKWNLFPLIEVAAQAQVITSDTKQQIALARNYRNLIHPGRTMRTGERFGKDTALGALSGVERLIREFSP